MINETAQMSMTFVGRLALVLILTAMLYEWLAGKYKDGKKTKEDWLSHLLGFSGVLLIQRPIMLFVVFWGGTTLFPQYAESLRWLDQQYFWATLIFLALLDEFIHGYFHYFAHAKAPKNKFLKKIQSFYKGAHRIHHTNGGNDGKGEINVMHTFAVSWCWFLILPNYTLAIISLYLGLYEAYFWFFAVKNLWGLHVHANWNYDLYFLNHKNPIVRKVMYGLCHILTFPTMHQQHHSRSQNSAKNMQTLFSFYDWLFWGTLAIEKEKPKIYGWRQSKEEEFNVFRRWTNMGQYHN